MLASSFSNVFFHGRIAMNKEMIKAIINQSRPIIRIAIQGYPP